MAKLSPNGYLSGSIMPAYMGASPYQSPHEVLDQCRAARAGGELPELDSLQIDIGNATENVILNRGLRMIGLQDYDWYNYQLDGTDAAQLRPFLLPRRHSACGLSQPSVGALAAAALPEPGALPGQRSDSLLAA